MSDVVLRHRQGGFTLDVEFALAQPWTVIFGASGAGKSTVLRIFSGLTAPDSGFIRIDGRTILDTAKGVVLPPGRRSIGFVSQQAALFPHLTAAENVAFGIRRFNRATRTARVAEMLSSFGAEGLAQRKAAQLSGGERQRVALARALAPQPDLLLLDEPLAALDDASAQDILARLLALELRVIYVSHDLTEIWRLPAGVIVLEAGRIAATGPLREVLAAHRHRLLQLLSS